MRKISPHIKRAIDSDPYFKVCARFDGDCDGRITIEHAFIYAGRQVDELWAMLPLCTYHHAVNEHQDGGDLNKEINEYLCLCRATMGDLMFYPKTNWWQRFIYLRGKYS